MYAEIAERRGWTRDQLDQEVQIRKNVLDAMKKQGIKDYISVASLFHSYHIDAKNVIANIGDLRKVLG